VKKISYLTICSLVLLAASPAAAQTFEIGGKSTATADTQKNKKAKPAASGKKGAKGGAAAAGAPAAPGNLSWGAGIDVTRDARAATQALKRGNPSDAAMYAQRAVTKAPQNAKLWFLLGYTSRLAGRYGQSVDAYQKGLAREAGSAEGLSGLAQTYAKMGRRDDAKRVLTQAIAAAPRNVTNILVLGELYIQSGDYQQGIATLQRAEAIKPSSHTELLMAVAYMKLKQMDKARALLARAKARDPKNVAIFRAVANFQRDVEVGAARHPRSARRPGIHLRTGGHAEGIRCRL